MAAAASEAEAHFESKQSETRESLFCAAAAADQVIVTGDAATAASTATDAVTASGICLV